MDAADLKASGPGWWDVERPEGSPPFVWARSKTVEVPVDMVGGIPLRLSFTCRPFTWPGSPEQGIEISINGIPVSRVELAAEDAEYTIEIPAETVLHGHNRIGLRFDRADRPIDVDPPSRDKRTLAVAFESLSIEPAVDVDDGECPGWKPGSGIVTGVASPVLFSFRPSERSVLRLEGAVERGPVRAKVWIRVGDRQETLLGSDSLEEGDEREWSLDLSPYVGNRVQIALGTALEENGGEGRVCWTRVEPLDGLPKPPNVLLIIVDTLRGDFLSAYGGPAKSPTIDELMERGVRFSAAYSHIPITGPSHSSLFTSLLPSKHRVHNNSQMLSDDVTTMAEILKTAGYTTSAFVSLGVLNSRFGFAQGFDHYDDSFPGGWMKNAGEVDDSVERWIENGGWEETPLFLWVHFSDPHEPYAPPNRTYPRVRILAGDREIGRISADGRSVGFEIDLPPGTTTLRLVAEEPNRHLRYRFPYFGFSTDEVTFDLGEGWTTTERRFGPTAFNTDLPATLIVKNAADGVRRTTFDLSCKERLTIAEIRRRYVEEIEYVDGQIGRLLSFLEERGLLEDTLIVFAADHGEGLGDHNHVGHISQLYDTLIRVPLSLTFSGHIEPGTVVERRVSLIDVLPTILDQVGIPIPENIDGHDLTPLIGGDTSEAEFPIVGMTFRPEAASDKQSIIVGDFKFIHSKSAEREWEELYNLRDDPLELHDLRESAPGTAENLREELESVLAGARLEGNAADEAELSEEDRARLRELGYIR